MVKNLITLSVFFMCAILGRAQNKPFPKAAFAGTWEHDQSHNNLVLIIKFENGKDYATITDVGTNEAPSFKLKAQMKNDKLVVNPQTHVNDLYIELNVKSGKLIFRSQLVIWDRYGKPSAPDQNHFLTRIYERIN